jgi:small conductance mechanosensitive channel
MLRYQTRAVVLAGVVCTFVAWATPGRSQQQPREKGEIIPETYLLAQAEAEAPAPKAVTTENPAIPVDELALLVKPLTLSELETEAAAWMELVKAKVKEISNAEIAIKRKNRQLDQEKDAVTALEDAQAALEKAEEAQKAATPGSPEAEEAAKRVEEAKESLAKAQESVAEATDTKKELEEDEEVKKAVEEAEQDVEEGGKTAAEKEEEKKEEAAAPTPDPDDFDYYCNQLGWVSYPDSQTGVEISCLEETAAPAAPAAPAETGQTEEAAKNIDAAAADIEAGGADSEAQLQEKQADLEEAAKQIEESSAAEEEVKKQLVVNVTTLQSEQTALVDRLKVVLDAMEAKGGDPVAYRTYIKAVSLIEVDVTDTTGLGVRVLSWIQSQEGGRRWGINIGKFAGILVVATIVSQVLGKVVNGTMTKFGASSLLREFVVMLVTRGGVIIGILFALTALEISLGPLLTVFGGLSFILAFALQSNLGNLASGLMIMAYKPFDVGDEVKIGGVWGFIDSITLANTKILSWRKQIVIMPNNAVWGGQIENYTAGEIRAWSLKVNVPYDQDVETVQKIWKDIAAANPLVLEKPAPSAFPWAYDGYSVELYCGFKTKKTIFGQLTQRCLLTFKKN